MKILMVINNMRADSGVCGSVSSISNELFRQGHDVYIASLRGNGQMIERLDIPSTNIIDLSKKNNLLTKIVYLRGVIKKLRIDVVHTHMHRPGIVGRIASFGTSAVTVVTEHSTYLPTKKWRQSLLENLIDGFLARRTDCLVAVSRSVAATFASRVGILPNLITVIHNAVDTKQFNATSYYKASSSKNKTKNILFAGRFAYEKHADLSIKILKTLKDNNVDARLIIAGSGTLKNDLDKLIKDEKLEQFVEFVGVVTNMAVLMSKMDVLLVTSYWEGCPMSIIESYACGLPVVATSVSGVIDIVDNLITGILIDPEDPLQGAHKIMELFLDKNLSASLINNGYKKLSMFQPEIIVSKYINCYRVALLKKHRNG